MSSIAAENDALVEPDIIESDIPISDKHAKNKKSSKGKSKGNYTSIGSEDAPLTNAPSISIPMEGNIDGSGPPNNQIIADATGISRGTLDESVLDTLKRDIIEINNRLKQVVYPHFPSSYALAGGVSQVNGGNSVDDLHAQSSDLWAPLTFVISYSLIVSHAQSLFSSLFITCWFILLVLALHLRLTKPHQSMSLISYISLSGYCLFPLVIQALLTQTLLPLLLRVALKGHTNLQVRINAILKLILISVCLMWATTAITLVTNAKGVVQVYPLALCLFGLAWLSISL
ncbi:hypothetical protein TPHA_0D01070 [Tetrapisispora phaffii CBS 4417]|uniref:Protein YIP n=1 Tax=Tetrapisispora phaffii (strain ATCC 24235 / CBS 4417 / NBRC 1672 / NRRL Y-8282 / UCD 70-5) TaxID=1071381 RepID=G8BSC7_TETPH|nr:hypothetical protein TPHA_0D01070 [Tetrapisispora phaffii CBS 4417]CCE62748.1 hypothetical protein TPHA_0D01070 [Tetrapisispora phaffii CBS 4417]